LIQPSDGRGFWERSRTCQGADIVSAGRGYPTHCREWFDDEARKAGSERGTGAGSTGKSDCSSLPHQNMQANQGLILAVHWSNEVLLW
jgi:hypothetical protein